jgi:L-ascorbate metabolism protein UlaG (beta-lactamase superfamily)
MRGLGFWPDEVVRADAVLIGHPHYDHISDAAQVASAAHQDAARDDVEGGVEGKESCPGQHLAVGRGVVAALGRA